MVCRRLLVAMEAAIQQGDAAKPLDVRHSVPARDDQPEREAVLRRERLPVDLVCEQDLVAAAIGEREAALVLLLDIALDAAVHPGEHHVARLRQRLGLVEQRA